MSSEAKTDYVSRKLAQSDINIQAALNNRVESRVEHVQIENE